ncbi:MAG TPA: class I SAM-dependent methyltransferase [Thermoanaerobaculia bacterium]|nr:class I SAM-dependent methyltransferase [Thermoanaerobaculia bacterium]
MGLIEALRGWLTEPELREIDPDSAEFTRAHRRILERKRLLRRLFAEFCERCLEADRRYFTACPSELRLEIGSGAGVMKEVFPDVLTSDVKRLSDVDLVLRAEDLPFADGSLRAIYGINVFHHVSDPRDFFRETVRALAPGGGLVLIEPYYGPLARLLFKRLFTQESYEMNVEEWPRHRREQVASNANQALSYVVLRRDRAQWEREFPSLELVVDEPHTHMTYLLSGGVNFRQLIPSVLGEWLAALESKLDSLNPVLALEHTLVIRKRRQADRPSSCDASDHVPGLA